MGLDISEVEELLEKLKSFFAQVLQEVEDFDPQN